MSAKLKPYEGGEGDFEPIRILQRGVDEWNLWRKRNRQRVISLREAYLRETNLNGADLSYADLTGADLSGAYLIGADLRGALLDEAKLSGAKLTGAYCIDANFKSAELGGTNLSGADFTDANIRYASLFGAKLRGSILIGADLQGTFLSGADLIGANLRGACLRGANLSGAYLDFADLSEADFRDVNLSGANLTGAVTKTTLYRAEPFRVYTESSSIQDAEEVYLAAKAFYEALGFSIKDESDWVAGSLWKQAIAHLKGFANSKELNDRARVAENILLGKHDRETAILAVKAIVDLENAFKGKKEAIAVDLGLFIFFAQIFSRRRRSIVLQKINT